VVGGGLLCAGTLPHRGGQGAAIDSLRNSERREQYDLLRLDSKRKAGVLCVCPVRRGVSPKPEDEDS